MVRNTAKILKRLNKKGINFDFKKNKFFTKSKRKLIGEIDCYNSGKRDHLAHPCPYEKKDK
jgi:hypothetical protein